MEETDFTREAENAKSSGGSKNILIGCTGSVATIKINQLIQKLMELQKVNIQVITTEHATHFFNPDALPVKVHRDIDEWQSWKKIPDPVLHIELRRWADVLVIAPLDANTLAKMANGMCDNLLTCVVRAWDLQRPLLFAPAMNTYMWDHPLTRQQIAVLKGFNYTEIPPIEKKLACGDLGCGAMADVSTIVGKVAEVLGIKNT